MEKKKSHSWFTYVFVVLFTSYLILFLASNNGYYEYKNKEKAVLTAEQIKKFEQDISEGKNVRLEEYIKKQNYLEGTKKNTLLKISEKICDYTKKTITETFKVLSKNIEN